MLDNSITAGRFPAGRGEHTGISQPGPDQLRGTGRDFKSSGFSASPGLPQADLGFVAK